MKPAFHQVKNLAIFSLLSTATVTISANAATLVDLEKRPFQGQATQKTLDTAASLGVNGDGLKVLRTQEYANGDTITRYQQYFQGIPVWNSAITEKRN
jgi:Zn-dependent metalloprotease